MFGLCGDLSAARSILRLGASCLSQLGFWLWFAVGLCVRSISYARPAVRSLAVVFAVVQSIHPVSFLSTPAFLLVDFGRSLFHVPPVIKVIDAFVFCSISECMISVVFR